MRWVVLQPTGFVPYFLYLWDGARTRWHPQLTTAKRFTRRAAQRIADQLNALSPLALHPIVIREIQCEHA